MADRILVVDDEAAVLEIVSSILASANYQYQVAGSGDKALAVLDSGEQFELLLTDIMMPGLDGLGLLMKIKPEYPDLPVVFMTSVYDASVAMSCFRHGASDYLLVPFGRGQLLDTIHRALKIHRQNMPDRAKTSSLESLINARTQQLREQLSSMELSEDSDLTKASCLDQEPPANQVVSGFTIAIAGANP